MNSLTCKKVTIVYDAFDYELFLEKNFRSYIITAFFISLCCMQMIFTPSMLNNLQPKTRLLLFMYFFFCHNKEPVALNIMIYVLPFYHGYCRTGKRLGPWASSLNSKTPSLIQICWLTQLIEIFFFIFSEYLPKLNCKPKLKSEVN